MTFVGKSWDYQVREALRVPLEENLAMIADTVAHIKDNGREAIFDAEHFFDGFKANANYTIAALKAAVDAGVDVLCLCDTNGGTLPHEIGEIVGQVVTLFPQTIVSMHPHNDGDCGTANALAAVRAGARQVQGTINGYGERTGNADLIPVVAALRLKMGYECLSEASMQDLTSLSTFVDEIANRTPNPQAAYVGKLAFTHKAGLHIDAIVKADGRAYEHVNPFAGRQCPSLARFRTFGRFDHRAKSRRSGLRARQKIAGSPRSPESGDGARASGLRVRERRGIV